LLDLIRSFKDAGISVLLSSHLLDRVQSVCDRVALFNNGKIALMGTIPQLGRQVLGGGYAVEIEAQGGNDVAARLREVTGVREVSESDGRFRLLCDRDVRPDAAAAVVTAGGRLTSLTLDRAGLETIYTQYFKSHDAALEVPHAA
jgi:ABC-2 type transport system ATP-binding protein